MPSEGSQAHRNSCVVHCYRVLEQVQTLRNGRELQGVMLEGLITHTIGTRDLRTLQLGLRDTDSKTLKKLSTANSVVYHTT